MKVCLYFPSFANLFDLVAYLVYLAQKVYLNLLRDNLYNNNELKHMY